MGKEFLHGINCIHIPFYYIIHCFEKKKPISPTKTITHLSHFIHFTSFRKVSLEHLFPRSLRIQYLPPDRHLNNYVVSLIELFVFLYYFHFIIQTKKLKFALGLIGLIIGMFFLLRLFLLLLFTNSLTVTPLHNFYVIESLVLLFCCICYFVELFKSPPVLKLTDTFNFWVSSGLLFYLFGTFPITLITNYFFSTSTLLYENLFTIINIFYILMFLMIVRAYLCKQVKLV